MQKTIKHFLLFSVVTFIVSNICAALYAFSCKYIYYWDNAIYWTFARDIAGGSIKNNFFGLLYDSLLTFDYNYLAALLPALFAYVFGTSRTVYIFAVVNCFFVPSVIAVYVYTKDILRSCIIMLAFPVLIFLALTGFVDIMGFAVCIVCYLLYRQGRNSILNGVLIGILLVLAILVRRWYAFFAVTFIVAMAVDFIVMGKNHKCLISSGVSAGIILLTFFLPLVINKLLADYSALYSGYKFSINTDIKLFTRYFGVLPMICGLVGSVWCVVKKDKRVIMPIVQMVLCFILFTKTQTHGQQHLLLYIPSAVIITSCILEQCNKKIMLVILACTVLISANTLIDRKQPQSLAEIQHYALLPDFSMKGRVRDDADDVLELKNRLDELCNDGRLGVNLSSFVVNADILKNVQPSLGADDFGGKYIEELPCVDSRDTDISKLYEMDYIISSTPVQTHLGEDKQSLVLNIDKCLKNNIAFGSSYQRMNFSYNIGEIEFMLYKRTKPITQEQREETEKIILK